MNNRKMSIELKTVIIFIAFLGIGLYSFIVPAGLLAFIKQFSGFDSFFLPWLIFISVSSVPLFVILGLGFAVSNEIGKDNSFSDKNVKYLRNVSICLIVEAIYFFTGNLVLWLFNLNYPVIVLLSAALCLFAVAAAVVFNVLAKLVKKAVMLREENEAII